MMNLGRFKRRGYVDEPTPIHFLPNLTKELNGPNIYIKRDDLLSGAGGGNKTRKLDFLVQEALDQGCDTLITAGAIQSNHCRLTASAAAKEGLKCHLVLEERVKGTFDPTKPGNNLLYKILGVKSLTVVSGGSDVTAKMNEVAEKVKKEGGKPYLIPGGGSNPLGALGYVGCATETLQQLFKLQLSIDHIVLPSGSAGTHAGTILGLHASSAPIPVTGISVSRKEQPQVDLVHGLVAKTATFLGLPTGTVTKDKIVVKDAFVGAGYSIPTDEMVEAVKLLGRTEGILLDPVYSGKGFAGLIGMIKNGDLRKGENVLFLHTGGSPALHVYADNFNKASDTDVINCLTK